MLFYLIAVGNRAKKDKQNNLENNPLVVAKPIVLNSNKIQTIDSQEADLEQSIENINLNDMTIETAASG